MPTITVMIADIEDDSTREVRTLLIPPSFMFLALSRVRRPVESRSLFFFVS